MADLLHVVVDEGLGNAAYVVDLGDGRALVVDPSLDLRTVRARATALGLRIAYVAETHLHADFLSGARELAATDGATIVASRAGGRTFDHVGLADREQVDLGGLTLQALSTPGHTDEHTAFLLLDGDAPLGVFSGGTLLVDSVARTDLVDPDRSEQLARHQYHSVRRLLELPAPTALWPTHGAGSFCAVPHGAARTSTIGQERATGSLAGVQDEDPFVRTLLGSLGSFPPYFRRLAEQNRHGARVPSTGVGPQLAPLDVRQVEQLRNAGATVVDVRTITRFATAHLPGSLSIELRPVFATWLGWLAPPAGPVVIVRDADQDPVEIAWQAAKVGTGLAGELSGGVEAWQAAGLPVSATPLLGVSEVAGTQLVDVRQASEFASGHAPRAGNVELGVIGEGAPVGPVVLMCGHGERAMTAASVLQAGGRTDVSVLAGGPSDVAQAQGVPVAVNR